MRSIKTQGLFKVQAQLTLMHPIELTSTHLDGQLNTDRPFTAIS